MTDQETLRQTVQRRYADVARQSDAPPTSAGACCSPASGCCSAAPSRDARAISRELGYSADETDAVPDGANLGLGCGNPHAIASLRPGETVLDLGSGAGFDCFLAARQVGPAGRVIGIDMTPEMLAKARDNARKGGYPNVEFRLGEIERLPVPDGVVDAIVSNCVINLSPDKPAVFREALRVLKPGGRLAISDVVATADLPAEWRQDAALVCGCMGNAAKIDEVEKMLRDAGFERIRITPRDESREFIREWAPGRGIEDYVISATIEAVKPATVAAVR